MEQERSIDRLARYIIIAATLAILAWVCWYFKSVLVYIIAAFVVSLIGLPVKRLLRKVTIRGKSAPEWLLAIVTILLILGILILIYLIYVFAKNQQDLRLVSLKKNRIGLEEYYIELMRKKEA